MLHHITSIVFSHGSPALIPLSRPLPLSLNRFLLVVIPVAGCKALVLLPSHTSGDSPPFNASYTVNPPAWPLPPPPPPPPSRQLVHHGGSLRGSLAQQLPCEVRSVVRVRAGATATLLPSATGLRLDHEVGGRGGGGEERG